LRSAGIQPDLLDEFLQDPEDLPATSQLQTTPEVFQALNMLGIGAFSGQDSLILQGDTLALRMLRDSLRADSVARAEADSARVLRLFGLNVFRQATTQFQPVVQGPVPSSYRLGPGDVLLLILTGDVELAYDLTVTRDGFIVIPDVGRISVANVTMDQLQTILRTRLAGSYSGIVTGTTQFDVTVSQVKINNIRVVGEVARPGSYQLAATASALSALYEAGGLTERSNFRNVQVRRGAELVGVVDLYDYLISGNVPADIALQSGDVVFVPIRGPRIKVVGEVIRPAIYEGRPGEPLRAIIQAAGGPTAEAHLENATLVRMLPPDERGPAGQNRTVRTVNLAQLLRDTTISFPVYDGDSLTLHPLTSPRRDAVTISGSVWQPGTYQLTSGMRIWDLMQAAGGVRPETYAGRAQIVRTRSDSTQVMLGVVLSPDGTTPPADNVLLAESDSITIYPRTDFRPARHVRVLGAVQSPGIFVHSDSMTLRDAVLMAGGLRDDAYLMEAEISRLPPYPVGDNGDSLATVLRVPLDSTYVFDPTADVVRPVGNGVRGPEVVLKAYDNVFIRPHPGIELQRNVTITGEVRFPGSYTLLSNDERLLDVIDRAGGLRPQAYANGIRFFRFDGNVGRISIALPDIIQNPEHRDNLIMTEGDSVYIPSFIPTVRVEGAVLSPNTSVAFVPGRNTDYYVEGAGGYSRQADKDKTYVQQPNGLIEKKDERPEPGAVIVVPPKDPSDRGINVSVLLGGIAQALTALTTVVLLLDRVFESNP
jgi:protein involved in polysaccharide export with SLBB domain